MVSHEAEDEIIRCGLREEACKGTVKEVWVRRLLRIETLGAEARDRVHSDIAARRGVDKLLELVDLGLVIVASLVEVGAGGRGIGFVSAVMSDKDLWVSCRRHRQWTMILVDVGVWYGAGIG